MKNGKAYKVKLGPFGMNDRDHLLSEQNVATRRIAALVRAGYQVDLAATVDDDGLLCLRHPAMMPRVAETHLIVTPSGMVIGGSVLPGDGDHVRIGPEQSRAFEEFLARVPKPTWWELNGASVLVPVFWVVWLGIAYGLVQAGSTIWRAVSGDT